jgi:hypothetical protein
MTKKQDEANLKEMQLVNQLSAAGFSGAQIEALRALFSAK